MKLISTLHLYFLMLTMLVLASCGQEYNSNYNDRGTYADIGIPPGTPLYNSYVILQNKCFSCHASPYQDYITDAAWISSGRVIAGSFNTSPIKLKLKTLAETCHLNPTQLSPLRKLRP